MKEFVIPIIVHDPELPVPEHKNWGDWVDLRSAEEVEMKQGEYRIISLGVSMRLPYGFEAHCHEGHRDSQRRQNCPVPHHAASAETGVREGGFARRREPWRLWQYGGQVNENCDGRCEGANR